LKGELYVQETPHIAQVSRPHPPETESEITRYLWAFNSRIFVAPCANAGQSRWRDRTKTVESEKRKGVCVDVSE
jgi:hypothetical protein